MTYWQLYGRVWWATCLSTGWPGHRSLNYAVEGKGKGKGKAVPLQVWTGLEGSRKLMFPDFMTTAQDGGNVVSLTHRPPLPPRKYSRYSFLLEAESTPGP